MEEVLNYIGENYRLNEADNSNIFYLILANTKNEQLCSNFKWKVVPTGVKMEAVSSTPPENWKELIKYSIQDINKRNPYLYLSGFSYRLDVVHSRNLWNFYNEKYYSFRGDYRPSEVGFKYISGDIMVIEEQILHPRRNYRRNEELSFKIGDKRVGDILKIEDEYEFIYHIRNLPEFLFKRLVGDRKSLAR